VTEHSEGVDLERPPQDAQRDHYVRILEFYQHVRDILLQLRADVDALSTPSTTTTQADRPEGVALLTRLTSALDEVLETARSGEGQIHRELTRILEEGTGNEDDLPPGLARFVADRASSPGFEYEVAHDIIRGRVLKWTEHTEDGWVRGSGLLYENPHAWIEE